MSWKVAEREKCRRKLSEEGQKYEFDFFILAYFVCERDQQQ